MSGKKFTGLLFSFCKSLSFLYTGITSDCFNSSGKVDSDDDRSGGEKDSVQMSQRDMGKNCYMTS